MLPITRCGPMIDGASTDFASRALRRARPDRRDEVGPRTRVTQRRRSGSEAPRSPLENFERALELTLGLSSLAAIGMHHGDAHSSYSGVSIVLAIGLRRASRALGATLVPRRRRRASPRKLRPSSIRSYSSSTGRSAASTRRDEGLEDRARLLEPPERDQGLGVAALHPPHILVVGTPGFATDLDAASREGLGALRSTESHEDLRERGQRECPRADGRARGRSPGPRARALFHGGAPSRSAPVASRPSRACAASSRPRSRPDRPAASATWSARRYRRSASSRSPSMNRRDATLCRLDESSECSVPSTSSRIRIARR